MSDVEDRAAIVVGICEAFGKRLSEPGLDMYLGAVAGLSTAELGTAAMRCIQTCKFFPPPAEILEAAGRGKVSAVDAALKAWTEAWAAASEHGAYSSIMFADVVTTRVIESMGGWPAFCQPTQEEQWHRRTFLDTYKALMPDVAQDERVVRLAGIHERSGSTPRRVPVIGIVAPNRLVIEGERSAADLMAEVERRALGAGSEEST